MLLKRIAATLLFLVIVTSLCEFKSAAKTIENIQERANATTWQDAISVSHNTWNGKTISTAEELAQFALKVNSGASTFYGETIILLADIDLSGKEWTPIGNMDRYFSGTFDGKGHKITGITINIVNSELQWQWSGLFTGISQEGTIKDLKVSGRITVKEVLHNIMGMIAGENHGKIINCSSSGKILAKGTISNFVGGITGKNGGLVENCTSECVVKTNGISTKENDITSSNVGGIVGENFEGIIKGCINKGKTLVSGGTGMVGGIVGGNYSGSILSCKNNGKITARDSILYIVGGIAGTENTLLNEYGTEALPCNSKECIISDCINNGDIVTEDVKKENQIGGIVGNTLSGSISNCTNNGNMAVNSNGSNYAGGIVGLGNCNIANCVNRGNIKTTGNNELSNYSGGIAGMFHGGMAKNSYNTGKLVSSNGSSVSAGIICCYETGTVENCYNIGETVAKGNRKYGFDSFAGGVLGRRTNEDSNTAIRINSCYWLCDKQTDETLEIGFGKERKLVNTYYFTDNSGVLKAEDGTPLKDTTLLDALNSWTVGKEGMNKWVIDPELNGGYPVFEGTQPPEEIPETGAGVFGWLFEVLFS